VVTLLANIASILGLFASLAAWSAASKAKQAARQARRAVRLADASEKLNNLGVRATELLGLVESDDTPAATLRGRDLTSELVRARLRWERFLSVESKTALAEAVAQVQAICLSVATRGIPPSPQRKQRLLEFCHSVNQSLNAECAKMLAEIESKEE
jgi:hypothetical protein